MADTTGQTSRFHAFVIRLRAFAVALSVGILGLVVAGILAAIVIIPLLLAGVELGAITLIVISLITGQGIAFGGVALGYLRLRDLGLEYVGVNVPSLRDVIAAVSGYILALLALVAGAIVVSLTQVETAPNQVSQIATENPEVLLLLIPASFLLIGPGEELLFRGVVQNRLREGFGPVVGVVLASAIFAAIHFTALTGGAVSRFATIGILFFPSLVFGSAYELTDNLVVPAFIHGAYNATLFTIVYIGLQYGPTQPTGLL